MNGRRADPAAVERLELGAPAEVAAYEKAFYAAFLRATHNRLVRDLWEWDDSAGRLRTRVPYAEQAVWVQRGEDGAVEAAVAVNLAMRALQGGAFGFACPAADAASRARGEGAEFLTCFATGGDLSLVRRHALWTGVFDALRGLGREWALATCAPRVLPLYVRMGATVLERRVIGEEERIFLRFDLRRTARV